MTKSPKSYPKSYMTTTSDNHTTVTPTDPLIGYMNTPLDSHLNTSLDGQMNSSLDSL